MRCKDRYGCVVPCYGCIDRETACHTYCERYKNYRAEHDRVKAELYEKHRGEIDAYRFMKYSNLRHSVKSHKQRGGR